MNEAFVIQLFIYLIFEQDAANYLIQEIIIVKYLVVKMKLPY